MKKEWKIWVDTGGTFTDCLAESPNGKIIRQKVLSSSCLRGTLTAINSPVEINFQLPQITPAQFTLGQSIRILGEESEYIKIIDQPTPNTLHLEKPLNSKTEIGESIEILFDLEAPILAARLATSSPPNKPLPPLTMHLATTKGTNALLEEKGADVTLFITRGFKDLLIIGDQKRPNLFDLKINKPKQLTKNVIEINERMNSRGEPICDVNLPNIDPPSHENQSAAIVFLNSYRNPIHEQKLLNHLLKSGWHHVSISTDLAQVIKVLPRAETTVVDAYLAPIMNRYLNAVNQHIKREKLHIMTSAGGLVSRNDYRSKDSLLSGPAGGVVGAAFFGEQAGYNKIIGFDMGGTSTDVCRFDGEFNYQFEHQIGQFQVVTPVLNIETVAAGGGSICRFNGEELCVGPESAGANPGPACYGAGGPFTITDANLLLGRLDPKGLGIPINFNAAIKELKKIKNTMPKSPSTQELLSGFLEIANERMADAVRKISIREGYDPGDYTLVAFGGAGGQHACAIADKLEISTILCPSDAGLLSARGLREAVIERFSEQQILKPLEELKNQLPEIISNLEQKALLRLQAEGFKNNEISIRRRLISLRHYGQDSSEQIEYKSNTDLEASFRKRYENLFGYWPKNKVVEVVSARVIASTFPSKIQLEQFNKHNPEESNNHSIERNKLNNGSQIKGPTLIQDRYSTINIDQQWHGIVGSMGTIKLGKSHNAQHIETINHNPLVQQELFTNRFQSIVEEMGELLKRTAISTNIKERLDFSCALLDLNGKLASNAPHIPVHLGALGLCVRSVIAKKEIGLGDVIITNHPGHGGSHLPDITVISPVFDNDKRLIGYIANRAHHAEIGGISPGSMPPHAKSLAEEGVVIPPTYLYKNNKSQFNIIEKILQSPPWPTRCIEDNLADIKAQAAANFLGVKSLMMLISNHGSKKVLNHIEALRLKSKKAMSKRIQLLKKGTHTTKEILDDGTELRAKIDIQKDKISINFNGTSQLHSGNFNATPAIVQSAVIYVLRLLVNEPIPLNEGLLESIDICLPKCLLNPDFPENPIDAPPVVGGNVETSQRLVNLLLKPFDIAAASQGTMNNLIFGNQKCSYYETICGGTGAGPNFNGADAVHSHMTNTAITDAEILEERFPVRLEQFSIRKNSGGTGKFNGGNGIVREILFTEAVSLSLLTQNRNQGPYGLKGGNNGIPGEQLLIKQNGKKIKLGPTVQASLEPGDRLIIKTPGGGGFGQQD